MAEDRFEASFISEVIIGELTEDIDFINNTGVNCALIVASNIGAAAAIQTSQPSVRITNYYESIIPAYSDKDFNKAHFRMYRDTFERMPKPARYCRKESEDEDQFETPAFVAEPRVIRRENEIDDQSDDSSDNSESGLGEDLADEDADINSSDSKDNSDDSEDDAPDDVRFDLSQEAEKKRMSDILKGIRKDKSDRKEQRRKKDEFFKEQKQEKIAALSKRKLPIDVLKAVSSKTPNKPKISKSLKDSSLTEHDGSLGEKSSQEKNSDIILDLFDREKNVANSSTDYIPLVGSDPKSQISVVALGNTKWGSRSLAQDAATFRERKLFGGKIKRVNQQELRSIKAKRKVRTILNKH